MMLKSENIVADVAEGLLRCRDTDAPRKLHLINTCGSSGGLDEAITLLLLFGSFHLCCNLTCDDVFSYFSRASHKLNNKKKGTRCFLQTAAYLWEE